MNLPQEYTCSLSWTLLPPPSHTIPLGHPSAPAPSILYPASNLDWRIVSYMILYMFQCHFPKSSPLPPASPTESKCAPMLIAALFIIARTCKQPRCPSADEWIRKLRYIYTMEYYSAIKKNTFESILMRWMKLESIMQSEVCQKEKHQYSILMFTIF